MMNVRAIWDRVVANRKRLDACASHDFSIDATPGQTLAKQWRCVHCGGEVDHSAKFWYEEGRRHAQEVKQDG